ncbi:OmpA family protein [Tellurirhabdus rosea]|uniref:OmpA family protein n=1 Tax=Tellurirhabdus rosea TaxID=2674997 RepID=UPI0022575027|nr:PA14 domain-containing protein [Tellurirhabdus rosea]
MARLFFPLRWQHWYQVLLTGLFLLFGLAVGVTGTALAQAGLKGEYFTGTNFEQKVFTRLDPQISFDWSRSSPGRGLPYSYYSIRWTGKLRAPATGPYRFYAKVDDGIRVWVGNRKVVESWQLNDSGNYDGTIVLQAGQTYDLRVDYFNAPEGGVIILYWERPDARNWPFSSDEPIAAQYFSQKPAPVPKSAAKPLPTVAVSKKPVTPMKPRPVVLPPKKAVVRQPPVAAPVPKTTPAVVPLAEVAPDTTFVLQNVQFEQSSYTLRAQAVPDLDRLVGVLKANPFWQLHIAGHTDNVGDPRLNRALSENRARVVASYLIQRGISGDRIRTEGFGGTRPVADNTTEPERSKNRRVEMTIRRELADKIHSSRP